MNMHNKIISTFSGLLIGAFVGEILWSSHTLTFVMAGLAGVIIAVCNLTGVGE
jgi:hypothetical protein